MKEKLYILWTNGDEITSEKMVLMYAYNALKLGWWKEITVVIWGSPNLTIANSELIKDKIKQAQKIGVRFSACKACADQLGTTSKLIDMGIEVKYWGEGLTKILKEDETLLTV
jgi:hypothetical protein